MVKPWTDEELAILREHYPDPRITFEEIQGMLPGRSPDAIRLKASRLRIERKTIYGDQYTSALELLKRAYYLTDEAHTKATLSEALDILDPQLKPQEAPT